MTEPTKTCPSCGGVILAVAKKCKHCKSYIDQAGPPATAALAGTSPAPLATKLVTGHCPVCGSVNIPGARKCLSCGATLRKRSSTMVAAIVVGAAVVLSISLALVIRCQQDQAVEDATGAALAATRARDREEAARQQRCREIVERVQSSGLTEDDQSWLGEAGTLAKRIQEGNLLATDLKLEKAGLPCGEAFADVFVAAATRSTSAWVDLRSADDVSPDLLQMLGQRPKPALAATAARAFRAAVDSTAVQGLSARQSTDLKDAKSLCEVASAVLGSTSSACRRLTARAERLESRETAASERRERRGALECAEACRTYTLCIGRCSQGATDTQSMYDAMKACGQPCRGEMTDDCAACSQKYR